jgi:hypothetical protein
MLFIVHHMAGVVANVYSRPAAAKAKSTGKQGCNTGNFRQAFEVNFVIFLALTSFYTALLPFMVC